MKTIKGANKLVACEPGEIKTVESEVKKGFAVVKNKIELIKLKVLFHSEDLQLKSGDCIYVSGDVANHAWYKNQYTVDAAQVILVPMQYVQLVELNE
jgi:hypothetical protein